MTGLARLLRLQARLDRLQLAVWIVGTGLLALVTAVAIPAEFGTQALRLSVVRIIATSPALLAIRSAPHGTGLGSVTFLEIYTYLAIMAAMMSTFLVVRHSRGDEELGRRELIGATITSRTAPLGAALLLALGANLLMSAAVTAGFVAGGLDLAGSTISGLAVGAVGISCAGVAAVIAQLAQTSRAANGLSAGFVGLAFLLRAAGDAAGTVDARMVDVTPAWPIWLSPIGWGEETRAFSQNYPEPLLLCVGLAVVGTVTALLIQHGRDVGSSYLHERPGPEFGQIRSPLGLAIRLQRNALLGWSIGAAVLGMFAGSLGSVIQNASRQNSQLGSVLDQLVPSARGSEIDILVTALLGFAGFLAAAAGIQAVIHARGEEVEGRLEVMLGSAVSRFEWMASVVAAAVASVFAVALVSGAVAALGFAAQGASTGRVVSSAEAGIAQLPAALVFAGLAAMIFAVVPRATTWLCWSLLSVALLVGQLGTLLKLPLWMQQISPFFHTPAVPMPNPNWAGGAVMVFVAIALIAGATAGIRSRDLGA